MLLTVPAARALLWKTPLNWVNGCTIPQNLAPLAQMVPWAWAVICRVIALSAGDRTLSLL